MQRLTRNDRGATAAIVALLMVPLLAVAAIAIDVAAMHVDKQQLQTGADAGALAVAQDCARDDCTVTDDTAQAMAASNKNDGAATGSVVALDRTGGSVTVETSSVREHWFAPVIGIDQTPIETRATARWGYPTGGTAVMPLAFSWCELAAQAGIDVLRDPVTNEVIGLDIPASTPERTILFAKKSETGCNGPSGNPIPGGFGWLTPHPQDCARTESVIDGWVGSDTGNNVPSACEPADFQRWLGETVLLPIYDATRGTGNSGEYRVFGYAAFTLTGYKFSGNPDYVYSPYSGSCEGSARCVRGSFDRFVDLTDDFDYSPSGPRLGAAVVALTE